MSHAIEWRCPTCQRPTLQDLETDGGLDCGNCDHTQPYTPEAVNQEGAINVPLTACVACGYDRLFAQKDFNRKLGLVLVLIGAALSPWTYGLSLLAFMGCDYALYRFVPEITVCYGCDAIHRDFEHNPLHRAHDPLLADRYKREAPINAEV
jgi:Zn ribbon nucleic-acid-binding protein